MKASLKALTLIILILSLSILAKPQPGACAIGWEYATMAEGNGTIVGVSSKGELLSTPATMTLTFDKPIGPELFIVGEMTLSITNRRFLFTAYVDNSGKIILTTANGKLCSGMFTLESMSLVLQDTSTGDTGTFILTPKL